MRNTTRYGVISCVSLLLTLLLAFSPGCGISVSSAHSVEVQNNSSEPVFIFSRSLIRGEWGEIKNWGEVSPGKKRAVFSMVPLPKPEDNIIPVEARSRDGKVLRSWEFPAQQRVLLVIDQSDLPQQ